MQIIQRQTGFIKLAFFALTVEDTPHNLADLAFALWFGTADRRLAAIREHQYARLARLRDRPRITEITLIKLALITA